MVKLTRIRPTPPAPRRRSLADIADGIIAEPIHGARVEHPHVRGEQLVTAVRQLASVGRTTDSIARELGIHSVDRVVTLRRVLGCPGRLDDEPREAAELDDGPPEAA